MEGGKLVREQSTFLVYCMSRVFGVLHEGLHTSDDFCKEEKMDSFVESAGSLVIVLAKSPEALLLQLLNLLHALLNAGPELWWFLVRRVRCMMSMGAGRV